MFQEKSLNGQSTTSTEQAASQFDSRPPSQATMVKS